MQSLSTGCRRSFCMMPRCLQMRWSVCPGRNPPSMCMPVSKCMPCREKFCSPPPTMWFFSNTATCQPSLAKSAPVVRPPSPPPMMIMWLLFIILVSLPALRRKLAAYQPACPTCHASLRFDLQRTGWVCVCDLERGKPTPALRLWPRHTCCLAG